MKVGVSTASLFTRKNNEDALPLLQSMGIKTVEVFLTSFSEYGYPFADLLKERKGGLEVNSVHDLNTQFEPQLFNAHARVKADAYSLLDKVLDSANALGAPYYTFHGTSRVKRSTHSGKYDDFPRMIEGFAELTAYCKARGVRLCLENVEWSTYNRPGVFKKLADEIPELGGVLDIKQARISEYPYEAYIKEMGEKLKYAHLSDFGDRGMCLPGKGNFDFQTLLLRLKDVGFDGALIIEAYQKDYTDPIELKRSCEYLEELIYKFE
ncbi:MAG: sugar phosphate isomerase/epimerase [Clostridia bacterium]|nr:sugar phosphate isomerase/epimerase [Clostridia bacterium]